MCNFQLHCIFFQGRYQTRKALSGGWWRDGVQWNVQRGLSDTFVECSCLKNKGRYLWQCAWSWILSTMINRIFSVISDFHNEMCYKVSIDKCVSSDTGSAWPARGFVISLLAIQRKKCISLVSLCKNHPFPYWLSLMQQPFTVSEKVGPKCPSKWTEVSGIMSRT